MFVRVLVANRGEIALRIVRTLREMSISSVAVYSDVDREAPHVSEADEAYRIGPPPAAQSYLHGDEIVRVALAGGADAVHPGYGFLAENAAFAEAVRGAGLTFIGPSAEAIRLMGDKIAARRIAREAGVPVVPGTIDPVTSVEAALAFGEEHGYPIAVKAAGGGGGRGIRVVRAAEEMAEALERAAREAGTYFKNPEVYLERYYPAPRHVEVQIVGDRFGTVVAWGERDCSTQRRHQKLIEETPAPGLTDDERGALFAAATACAAAVQYVGVGTVEFLYTGPGEFFFLEMNTRIQVEHTITEAVTGLDLIRESIRVAAGEPVTAPAAPRGHAIEARINAEDPGRGFAPAPGLISRYRPAGGPGIRIDSGVYEGFTIPADYDSMVAKLVAHAPTREEARRRLLRALGEYVVEGVPTTIPLHQRILDSETFREGRMTTSWLDEHLAEVVPAPQAAPAAANESTFAERARTYDVEVNGKRFVVKVAGDEEQASAPVAGARVTGMKPARRPEARSRTAASAAGNSVISPMHGTVVAVKKRVGDSVTTGETVFVIEAMKMENDVPAPRAGTIAQVAVAEGDTVEVEQELAVLAPAQGESKAAE